MDEKLIIVFVAGSFLFSFAVLFFVMKVLAKAGWSKLAQKYEYLGEFQGEKMGAVSVSVGSAQYSGAIIMHLGAEGMYLRPVSIFRFSHKPILIPISTISNMEGGFKQVLNTGVMVISESPLARITIGTRTLSRLRKASGLWD